MGITMKQRKPLIGILPLYDSELDSIWMLPGYLNGLHMAQADTIILPYTTDKDQLNRISALCDGFLFTGGQDVNPKMYQESVLKECGEISDTLDILTKTVFEYALKKDKAILGICRGCQIINVLFGGTLYQDLYTQRNSNIDHHQQKPYINTSHRVSIIEGSYLRTLFNTSTIEVNSIHHQAIKDTSAELLVNAVSEDGLVEAVKAKSFKYILGIQWHPEYNFEKNSYSSQIFKDFIRSL